MSILKENWRMHGTLFSAAFPAGCFNLEIPILHHRGHKFDEFYVRNNARQFQM